ncbi:MAG: TatD family hydrolase [Proteobacteria bacterium]|nr:TatD family hydrolase [Pseudomonadota bacterium]
MLVDSHCHLDVPAFAAELDEVVARARRAGVGRLVTICTRLDEFERVRVIAERFPDVYCSVGVHPHEAGDDWGYAVETLIALADHPKVVGIGESGLDYYYEHSPRDAQQRSFRVHIAAARATGLPLIVHTRDAEPDTLAILADEQAKGSFRGVIHCFSGSRSLAEGAVALGLMVSLSGIVTFKKADGVRDAAAMVPADRLLIETDAPFLAPVPHRGKRNEPAFVVHTAAVAAELAGLTPDGLAARTTANFFELFSKVPRPAPGAVAS